MSVRIMTDSASDFSLEELEKYGVTMIPMQILAGDDAYEDDRSRPMGSFWDVLKEGKQVKTSLPSPASFLDAFEAAKDAGDEVVCVTIAEGLSGTYQSAVAIKEMVDWDKIYILEGGAAAAAAAERLLVIRACELRDQGLTGAEIVEDLRSFRSKIRLFACLNTLEYLARGGRLPKSVALIGNAIKLKPMIAFSQDGKIDVLKKCLGERHALKDMVSRALQYRPDLRYPIIPLYPDTDENCLKFLDALREAGFDYPMTEPQPIGATIGTYIGPGAYGIALVEE